MAQTIKIKRSTVTAVPSSLAQGELAYSAESTSNKLFIGTPGTGDVIPIGGKYYVDIVDSINLTGSGTNTDPDNTITGGLSYNLTTGNVSSTLVHADRLGSTVGTYGSAIAIPVVTVDKEGHVTAIETAAVATALTIKDDSSDTDTVDLLTDTLSLLGGNYITTNITAADTVTFSHDSTTRTDTTSTESKRSGQNFTAVDSVTTNAEGHITAVNVKTVTLTDTLDTVTDAGNTTDNDISVGDLTVKFTGPQPAYVDIKDSRSTVLFNNLDAAGFQRNVASITGVSTDNGGNGELVFSTYYSGTKYDNIIINGTSNTTTFIGETTQGVVQNVVVDPDGYYPTITFNGSTEGDLTTQDSQYIDNRKILTWDTAAAFTHTLDTVTDSGNITDNDIQVNNLRVEGGSITGPATITIDPDGVGSTGTVVIAGDLTVQGTTTTIDSNTVSIGDNIIVLNGDETGSPTQNAGIEVERGTSDNVSLRWNETLGKWQTTVDGTSYSNLITAANFEAEISVLDGGTF